MLKKALKYSMAITLPIVTAMSTAKDSVLMSEADPIDIKTRIVQVVDPQNLEVTPIPLLLTNGTGYKIECEDHTQLKKMFVGLGLETDMSVWIEKVSPDDDIVISSHYVDQAALNCKKGDEDLVMVEFPSGDKKYFIDFIDGKAISMVGCQGLLDSMGYDIGNAIELEYELAERFVDMGDEWDINCHAGVKPGAITCGDYVDGDVWTEVKYDGEHTYRCDVNTPVVITPYSAESSLALKANNSIKLDGYTSDYFANKSYVENMESVTNSNIDALSVDLKEKYSLKSDIDMLTNNLQSSIVGIENKFSDNKSKNSDQLDGFDSTDFLRSNSKAVDADKLDGLDSSYLINMIVSLQEKLNEIANRKWQSMTVKDSVTYANSTGHEIEVRASGGYNTSGTRNSCHLSIVVDGIVVQSQFNTNEIGQKTCVVGATIPNSSVWKIISRPYPSGVGPITVKVLK